MPDPSPIPTAVPPTPPPSLTYEREPLRVRPPRWVVAVVAAYLTCIVGMLAGATYLVFDEDHSTAWVGVGTLLVLLAAWAAMLFVPVRAASRRPMSRRSIWVPLIASGFFAALLIFGAILSVGEVLGKSDDPFVWTAIGVASAGWLVWAIVFWTVAGATSPQHVGTRLARWLLAGSVLELLIAIPSHVYVRRRGECCAGIATGAGICIGVAVMFMAFGPGVVMLYLKRVRQISNH